MKTLQKELPVEAGTICDEFRAVTLRLAASNLSGLAAFVRRVLLRSPVSFF